MLEDVLTNTLEHLKTGGWVMIPLIGVSVAMFYLIVRKYIDLRAFSKGDKKIEEIIQRFHDPDLEVAPWQKEIVDRFLERRTFDQELDRSVIESLRIRQHGILDRQTKMIVILASVAPLLGLLGTVGGMISTFAVISQYGTGNAKALASGISEALITTQTGLIVAVPGLFFANYLARQAQRHKERMKRFCIGLLMSHAKIDSTK